MENLESLYTRWDSDFKPYLLDKLFAWMYPTHTFISLYNKYGTMVICTIHASWTICMYSVR